MKTPRDTPFARAQRAVKALGLKLTATEPWRVHDYAVNYIGGRESTAYYCDTIEDALSIADKMRIFAKRRL